MVEWPRPPPGFWNPSNHESEISYLPRWRLEPLKRKDSTQFRAGERCSTSVGDRESPIAGIPNPALPVHFQIWVFSRSDRKPLLTGEKTIHFAAFSLVSSFAFLPNPAEGQHPYRI